MQAYILLNTLLCNNAYYLWNLKKKMAHPPHLQTLRVNSDWLSFVMPNLIGWIGCCVSQSLYLNMFPQNRFKIRPKLSLHRHTLWYAHSHFLTHFLSQLSHLTYLTYTAPDLPQPEVSIRNARIRQYFTYFLVILIPILSGLHFFVSNWEY